MMHKAYTDFDKHDQNIIVGKI